jgi:hypothetical protein
MKASTGGVASRRRPVTSRHTEQHQTTNINLMLMQEAAGTQTDSRGDLVTVKTGRKQGVRNGEIARPSALLMRNGRTQPERGLGEAGGANLNTANTSQIYVIRTTSSVPLWCFFTAASPDRFLGPGGFIALCYQLELHHHESPNDATLSVGRQLRILIKPFNPGSELSAASRHVGAVIKFYCF